MSIFLQRSMMMQAGTAEVTDIAVLDSGAVIISSDTNSDPYDSVTDGTGQFTVSPGSNRLLVVAVTTVPFSGGVPASPTATFGGVSMELLIRLSGATASGILIFYLKDADIPSGASTLEVTFGGGVRNCIAAVRTYEGVDQTTPFGTPVTDTATTDTNFILADVTVASATSWVLSCAYVRVDDVTSLPATINNGSVVLSGETGTANNNTLISVGEDAVLATGVRRHTHSFATNTTSRAIVVVEMNAAA